MPKQELSKTRNWYVIHTYSGYEEAVAKNLRQRVESLGMEDKIFDVLVPKERKIKIQKGKRKIIDWPIFSEIKNPTMPPITAKIPDKKFKNNALIFLNPP